MRYAGNTAYQLDTRPAWEVPVGRSLSVHEGGRADARRRAESASVVAPVVRLVIALVVTFVLVGVARVAITSATVSSLKQVAAAESSVREERVMRTELQMERSVLASADRIQRIATENYGMVYATEVDTVVLSQREDVADDASADDAQTQEEAATDSSVS